MKWNITFTVEDFKKELEDDLNRISNNIRKHVRFKNASEEQIRAEAWKLLMRKTLKEARK